MSEVSTFRLYVLRATYLFMAVGLGITIWPGIVSHPTDLEHLRGVVRSMLGAVGLLALVGIRYPLKMLPLMFFELVWKTIWVLSFWLPLWAANAVDADARESFVATIMGVILFPIVIPWRYVWGHYIAAPANEWRWRGHTTNPPRTDITST